MIHIAYLFNRRHLPFNNCQETIYDQTSNLSILQLFFWWMWAILDSFLDKGIWIYSKVLKNIKTAQKKQKNKNTLRSDKSHYIPHYIPLLGHFLSAGLWKATQNWCWLRLTWADILTGHTPWGYNQQPWESLFLQTGCTTPDWSHAPLTGPLQIQKSEIRMITPVLIDVPILLMRKVRLDP